MSLWSRLINVVRVECLDRELDEELQSHLDEAVEEGRDPREARRALGNTLRQREASRDLKLAPWLDSLRADGVFAWRQMLKKKPASAAAILSLGLGIGACLSAYRLIDALLLRPLPLSDPDRLYVVARRGLDDAGKPATGDEWAYPAFAQMRAAVKGQAELVAISYTERVDLTYRSDAEMEKASLQYVSGWMFPTFGLRPAVGRLFTERDDLKPGAHPYAVLSHDYWTRRFGRDPNVAGRTFRLGNRLYEIVGVADAPFSGTERGTVTDVFVPTMMHPGATKSDWIWMRTLAVMGRGIAVEPVRARLHAVSRAFEEERAKGFTGMSRESIERFLDLTATMEPVPAGISGMQQNYREALLALAVLVGLVLLIACANVANLMAAQAAARAREMALRVSIGAGRGRMVQLVLVESAWLAVLAALVGCLFAWWSAPFVIGRISSPDNPAQLDLPMDWKVLAFGLALTLAVTFLFGLAPALRASAVKPASALKGGDSPHARRRLMQALIAAQVAFCFVVLFVSGLFISTFDRLSHRPLGFSPERVLTVEAVAQRAQMPVYWDQVAEHLRGLPGVEQVALAGWPLLSGNSWNGFISVNGAPPGPVLAQFMSVSPGWTGAMKIPFIEGGDFQANDTTPGVAIVNQTFVKEYFTHGERSIGTQFAKGNLKFRVVGVVGDAPYRNMREPAPPVAYVPFRAVDGNGGVQNIGRGTFVVRTSGANPLALASTVRREVPRARSEFRVSNVRTQAAIVEAQTIRERLLAMLALFFAAVALLLAAIGLYGVLVYSVLQRRREIGIRMAIGAPAGDIARRIAAEAFAMVLAGAAVGIAGGVASARYVESLLYQVKADDVGMFAIPALTLLAAALVAAMPAVIRAVRIDPVSALRAE